MKSWIVPYRATTEGETIVEAETAEEAIEKVEEGVFESDPGEERVDWLATGDARPTE